MSTPHSGRGIRRGLLIALNGLAIWLLAIILSGYASGSIDTAGAGLPALVTGTMQTWIQSPQLGVWQLAAYAGIAIAVVGPAWFWVVGPASEALRGRDSAQSGGGGQEPSAATEQVTDGGDSEIDAFEPIAAATDRIFSADPGSRQTEREFALLEAVGPQNGPLVPQRPAGDFLRSSSGRDAAGEGDKGDSSQPARAKIRYSEPDQATMDEDDQPEESVSAPASETVEESGASPTDGHTSASEESAGGPSHPGRDPTEAIATAVSGAREKLDTVRSRMPPMDGTSSIDSARNGLSSVEPISGETVRSITEES